ncbi:SH3 domain-containing protein [Streptomyces sp. B21-083]|uniref:SH3 domain-containing protein n=1 Tax=Streptomyces sp. B21-083 TaxID=3039410 RepID=UPI002FF4249C
MRKELAALLGAAAMASTLVMGLPATASAVTLPSACPKDLILPVPQTLKATTTVNLRSGPGTSYTAKGSLATSTKFEQYCSTYKSQTWDYGKVLSGANKGKWGWVADSYLKY